MISVVIATYNGEKFIKDQLDSILDQSVKPDEIIISDDGSTDNTLALVNDVLEESGIRYIININEVQVGYCQNFSKGLALSNGDYIFLSDQDDSWCKNKIEVCIKYLQSGCDIVLHDMLIGDYELKIVSSSYLNEMQEKGWDLAEYCSGCAMAMTKKFLNYCMPIPKKLKDHDVWFNELGKMTGTRLVINESLSIYRRHNNNTTSNEIFEDKGIIKYLDLVKDEMTGYFFYRGQYLYNSLMSLIENKPDQIASFANLKKFKIISIRANYKSRGILSRIFVSLYVYATNGVDIRFYIKDLLVPIVNKNNIYAE